MTKEWQVVIGLEVHAQVLSKTKLFSHAPSTFGASPNSAVDLLDAGMPGSLPVLNQFCVDQAIKTGLSLYGEVNQYSRFDRKNYFYPDLPTGYQISQFYHPIVTGGFITLGAGKKVRINHIHLEQDAGKSIHDLDPTKTLLDFNRAGIALMEIVTEPDMRSPEEAAEFMRKLRNLLRYMGTCDGNMEEGSLRADANISLCRPGEPFGTRAEIKNLNSIRFLMKAIEYEIERQKDILESGNKVKQETRLFNSTSGVTVSMRSKEEAEDYRYFPDPDLPPLIVDEHRVHVIREHMPELPDTKKARYINEFKLSDYDAEMLSDDRDLSIYFETCLMHHAKDPKLVANWMISELFSFLKRDSLEISDSKISPEHLAKLTQMIAEGVISGKIGKEVIGYMWESGQAPDIIVTEKNLKQISDPHIIAAGIDEIINNNKEKVEQYRGGKEQLFGFFVGAALKHFQGKANPELVNQLLKEKL